MRRGGSFTPFETRGRWVTLAILIVFALFSVLSVGLLIRSAKRSRNQGAVVEIAARQRTLAERYVNEVLLSRDGARVDPGNTAAIMKRSARALHKGGVAPDVSGDDDRT